MEVQVDKIRIGIIGCGGIATEKHLSKISAILRHFVILKRKKPSS
jgi:predicted dehydrogenase